MHSKFCHLGIFGLIHKATEPVVALPGGGDIVIEHTEAMTMMDVNTGSFVGDKSLEETVFAVNMRAAAEVLKGRKVADNVRCIIIPATQQIWKQAMHEGLFDIFIDAGAVVSTPTCGPCLGGHMGILAEGERAVSTTNRNFVGRMGHVDSEIYLASPYVAAACAVTGTLTDPALL